MTFGFSSLFCWVPRRRKEPVDGDLPPGAKRRGRRRRHRHIHANAAAAAAVAGDPHNLAPLRITRSEVSPTGGAVSPLSNRHSIVFTDSEYHDALEDLHGSMSSRTSADGSPLASPGGSGHNLASIGEEEPPVGLLDLIALWWEGRRASTTQAASFTDEATPRSAVPLAPVWPHTPASTISAAVPEEVIEQSPPDAAKMGCIGLFTVAHAHKKFLRLAKPPAGSSFRVEPPVQEAGEAHGAAAAGGAAGPATPPQLRQSQSVVARLLSRLSPPGLPRLSPPGTPRSPPLLQRLLSPRKHARKTEQEGPGVAAAWGPAECSTFMVRSQQYLRTKVKEGSGPAIYRLLSVDVYSFDFKLFHIAQHVQLPEAPRLGPEALALPHDQQLPPLLIINLQLPWYPPSLFGANDGKGHSLVYYFALPEGWEPSQVDNKAALAMVQRFVHNKREFDGSPTRDRFKLIPRIINVDEWAEKGPLSGYEHRLLVNYNEKPLLTRPQQRFYTGPGYLEIDLDVHNYAFIARKAFHGYIHRLAPVVFENAFVVQGNRPEELPEQVLAAARVYRCDFDNARPFPARSLDELGNGTGPQHDGEAMRT